MKMTEFVRGTGGMVSGWVVRGVYFLIWLYQRIISPCLPASCRFFPSCSVYAQQALCRHGFWKGSVLTIRRLLRCHPLNPGGIDPVP